MPDRTERAVGVGQAVINLARGLIDEHQRLTRHCDEQQRRLDDVTAKADTPFARCGDCGQVGWNGSHHRRLEALIGTILRELAITGHATEPSTSEAAPR